MFSGLISLFLRKRVECKKLLDSMPCGEFKAVNMKEKWVKKAKKNENDEKRYGKDVQS